MRIECIPLCHYAMLLKCCKSLGGCHLKHPGNEPPSRSAKQLIFPTWSSQWWTSNVDHPMNQFLANEWYRKELCNIVMQLLPASTQLLLLHKKKLRWQTHVCHGHTTMIRIDYGYMKLHFHGRLQLSTMVHHHPLSSILPFRFTALPQLFLQCGAPKR